ncbi:efflux RND transporter periplasmic adaptor subunit [Christiangramia fulva]|uniref:Efflux RND transporter periplasmic adaptor subunit n=1 Tax=Christiangramia fulva TaxID=2126553 RepID=A0A2R3Z206_9FLAO|nr:efflux RND transporter periplasmic adaptor subunit [Christiangramia fulva]AVR44294.1 efflux RND transporter periplasmic adaptor subunit [Christiangramia fulva]
MKSIESNKRNIIAGVALLLFGMILGSLFFGGSDEAPKEETAVATHDHESEETLWTCSMHPQIRETEPGNCPICGMELIPLKDSNRGSGAVGNFQTEMTEAAVQLGNIQTSVVTRQAPEKTIYMPGKVEADERLVESVTSRFPGRVEKLYVNFTGQEVARGQRLASVYSPALVTAQKELFEAAKFKESNPSFYSAAVNKLKLWDLTESQINNILESRDPVYYFDIRSKQSGTVLEKKVEVGDYLKEGQALFQVSNLNKVWVLFDAYENDLAWVKEGDKIKFTVKSVPGRTFESKVTFIDPVINPGTRVAQVRTELQNPDGLLKPGMFTQGIVQADISNMKNALTIPKSAVLWTGKRAVVYVKKPETEKPVFEFREIELGPEAGDYYLVNSGLEEGEEVVTNGAFKIDAAAQLQGKASMMSPEGNSGAGSMPGMDMGEKKVQSTQTETKEFLDEDETYDFKKQASADFRKQLDKVLSAYLDLKEALAQDKDVKDDSSKLLAAVEAADENSLEGKAQAFWQEKKKFLIKHAKLSMQAKDLAAARENFIYISQALIKTAEAYGPGKMKLYVDFCPMANSNKGAYWMSLSEEIKNPYYGQAMSTCGEVKSVIK